MILHSEQKTLPRSFNQVVQSLKPTQCSCVLVGCMILMFSKFLNSQCFYHTRRCPKNWPPLYTFKSSTVGSQTMQPFSCCIIEQVTLETSKKCINSFVFRSKDGVRCHATPDYLSSHTSSLYVVTKREWSFIHDPLSMKIIFNLFLVLSSCVVILRTPPYWSVWVASCNYKLGG